MVNRQESPAPWYKEFWFWFVWCLPLLAITACILLLIAAITFNDEVVSEHVQKRGLIIEARE